jgi:chromosome segregation ATPase
MTASYSKHDIDRYEAKIEQLKADVEHWKCEDANGVALIEHLSAEIDNLNIEIANLRDQINTCRELRKYDRIEIERLRILLDKR